MANINNINQLQDTLKDNKTLSPTEKVNLNTTNSETYKAMKNQIAKQEFELGTKKTKMKLEDIIKNFDTVNYSVKVGNEMIKMNKGTEYRGSDIGAWIQTFLIANGQEIYFNSADKSGLDIDGKIGAHTLLAINAFNDKKIAAQTPKTPEPPKTPTPERITEQDGLEIKNLIKRIDFRNNYSKGTVVTSFIESTSKGTIDKTNGTLNCGIEIATKKMTYTINTKNLGYKTYKIDLNKVVTERSPIKIRADFEDFMMNEFKARYDEDNRIQKINNIAEDQKKLNKYNADFADLRKDFKDDIKGITSPKEIIRICNEYASMYSKLERKIKGDKSATQLKSDFIKLAVNIHKEMNTLIGGEKTKAMKKDVSDTFNNLTKRPTDTIGKVDFAMDNYKSLQTTIKQYVEKDGMPRDLNLDKSIKEKMDNLTIQRKYLTAKNRFDTDLVRLEKIFNGKMTGPIMQSFNKEINERIRVLNSPSSLYLPTPKIFIKDAFVKVNKLADYQKYVNRYIAMKLN